jgi:NitT/TauT family transport system substrate-binding protein
MRLGPNKLDLRKAISYAAMLGVACAGLLAGPTTVKAQDVKLNEVLRSLFYTPQYVALRIGAFEQEGIKIAGPKTTWGAQATLTEIVSGNSDIALIGPEAVALTQQAGPDRRLINFAALTNTDGSFILSKTPMPNFKIADLKGKTIVTSGKGSTPVLVLEHLIRQAGLDPAKDVTIRNIPVSANVLPSYLEPNTQFGQSFEPGITQMVSQGKGHRVASVGALLGAVPYTAYATTVSYLEKNPKVIQGFTNAIYKALIWTDTHSPQEIAKLIAPDFKNVPEDTIATVVAEYKKVNTWASSPVITPEGMKKMLDLLVGGGILKETAPYDRVVNPTFAQKAEQSIKR